MDSLRTTPNYRSWVIMFLLNSVVNSTFTPPNYPYPEASRVDIGRDFYALSANLPEGTEL